MISILCIQDDSNYYKIPGNLDLWNKARNTWFFNGSNPVITHAPCQQWSRMRGFANQNKEEKELAFFCLEKVNKNGGIFEHPADSSFFKYAGIKPSLIVDQVNFGFRGRKRTWLYFKGFTPLEYRTRYSNPFIWVSNMDKKERSKMTLSFCMYLIKCIEPNYDFKTLISLHSC